MLVLTGLVKKHLLREAGLATHCAYRSAEFDIQARGISPTQREAIHVAHLCREISIMAPSWRRELKLAIPGSTLTLASVFTHQTPYVSWTIKKTIKRCELADLLIAVIDRTTASPQGFAAMVQAKMSADGDIALKNSSELKQFELLTTRPLFDLEAYGSPKQVDLRSYHPDSALLYGLATERSMHAFRPPWSRPYLETWLTADDLLRQAATGRLTASRRLSSSLLGLLEGSCGWRFDLPPPGADWRHFSSGSRADAWSELINYLLTETFGKLFSTSLGVAAGRGQRGQSDIISFISKSGTSLAKTFFVSGDSQSRGSPLENELQSESEDWTRRNVNDSFDGDGGFGDEGPQEFGADTPGGGVSSILIEIGNELEATR